MRPRSGPSAQQAGGSPRTHQLP